MNRFFLPALLALLAGAMPAHAVGTAPNLTGNLANGQRLFIRCASCHAVGPYASGGYGPQLNGIIGRKAASTTDYKYSEAMKKSGIVWTEQMLAAYMRAPHDVVPDTKMRFWGIKDDQQIADLLSYMRTLK